MFSPTCEHSISGRGSIMRYKGLDYFIKKAAEIEDQIEADKKDKDKKAGRGPARPGWARRGVARRGIYHIDRCEKISRRIRWRMY
jgi:hypothetical protein